MHATQQLIQIHVHSCVLPCHAVRACIDTRIYPYIYHASCTLMCIINGNWSSAGAPIVCVLFILNVLLCGGPVDFRSPALPPAATAAAGLCRRV